MENRATIIQELIKEEMLINRPESDVEMSELSPTSGSGPFPLSFAQQRLWYLTQQDKQSCAYNMPFAMRLNGGLIVKVLRESITEIVRRHESLRTTFGEVEGQPIQVISPTPSFEWKFTDLSHLPTTQRESEMEHLALQECARVFDLVKGPLVRVLLLRLDVEDHLLLIVMPHLITDSWSGGILRRELSLLYHAYAPSTPRGAQQEASPLPPLPIHAPRADFASWPPKFQTIIAQKKHSLILAKTVGGRPSSVDFTDRPSASRGAKLFREPLLGHIAKRAIDAAQGAKSRSRCHLVHDLTSGFCGSALSLLWARRHSCRKPSSYAKPSGCARSAAR